MKKTILFFVAIAISLTINAQIIALHSSTGVQIFKGNAAFEDAYTAAQNTDTLYLSGNTFTPPTAFDKQLLIFGAGHYVDSTLATGKTFINGGITLTENADGFYLEGVEITAGVSFTNDHSVNNVTFKRCKINGAFSVTGDLSNPSTHLNLIGNIFVQRLSLYNAEIALISNSIIVSGVSGTNGNFFSNNLFLNGIHVSAWVNIVFGGDNNQMDNNIFIFDAGISNGVGNRYNNNLFVMASPSYGTTPTTTNNYTGVTQATIFVNQTGLAFDYAHDYHLQAPTTYLGTDGTEVGIYGGIFPYKEGAVPLNPHIQVKTIAPTTDANGDLNIQIQVAAQED